MRQMSKSTRIIRPDNTKCPTVDEITKAVRKLESRLTGKDIEWWNKFRNREMDKREKWEALTDDDYEALGSSFTLDDIRYTSVPETDEEEELDEETSKRIDSLYKVIKKENTFREVSVESVRTSYFMNVNYYMVHYSRCNSFRNAFH